MTRSKEPPIDLDVLETAIRELTAAEKLASSICYEEGRPVRVNGIAPLHAIYLANAAQKYLSQQRAQQEADNGK